jgi:hypothetical protein
MARVQNEGDSRFADFFSGVEQFAPMSSIMASLSSRG